MIAVGIKSGSIRPCGTHRRQTGVLRVAPERGPPAYGGQIGPAATARAARVFDRIDQAQDGQIGRESVPNVPAQGVLIGPGLVRNAPARGGPSGQKLVRNVRARGGPVSPEPARNGPPLVRSVPATPGVRATMLNVRRLRVRDHKQGRNKGRVSVRLRGRGNRPARDKVRARNSALALNNGKMRARRKAPGRNNVRARNGHGRKQE